MSHIALEFYLKYPEGRVKEKRKKLKPYPLTITNVDAHINNFIRT
jgi:hypothetical protein